MEKMYTAVVKLKLMVNLMTLSLIMNAPGNVNNINISCKCQ